MKITKKILENVIREEIKSLLIEQDDSTPHKPAGTTDHMRQWTQYPKSGPHTVTDFLEALLELQKSIHIAHHDRLVDIIEKLKKVASDKVADFISKNPDYELFPGFDVDRSTPVNMKVTGGLDASLEEMVREELEKILEQGIDPVVGKPVTLGGQRISREEAFSAFEAELSKMHNPEVVSKFMEALEERLSGI